MLTQPQCAAPAPPIQPLTLRMAAAYAVIKKLEGWHVATNSMTLNRDGAVLTLADNTKRKSLMGHLRGHSRSDGNWYHYETNIDGVIVRWRVQAKRADA